MVFHLNSNDFKIVGNDAANHQVSPESGYIPFSTKVNLENDGDLYSACSNPTIVKSHAVLLAGVDRLILEPINLGAPNI